MKNAKLENLNKKIEFHLENWAKWHQIPDDSLFYKTSKFLKLSGGNSFDDMVLKMDQENAKTLDTIILDLPKIQKYVIYHLYLKTKIYLSEIQINEQFEKAKIVINKKLNEKNIY